MAPPLPFDPIAEARRQWDGSWGAAPGPSMSAVTSIMRSQQILMARLNDALREWELTFPRYEALMLLFYSRKGALPLGKISDRLQVHRASVTNVIDRLVDQGLVVRRPHDSDRRTVMATITPRGRDVARAATAVLNGSRFGMDGLTDAECESVTTVLEPLRRAAGDFTG